MNSSQMFVSRGRRHGAQSRACNGHAFTILNNTKSNTINTNQYTIHASCDRVLQSGYIGIMWQTHGLVVIDDSISKVFLLLYKRNILILRAFLGF